MCIYLECIKVCNAINILHMKIFKKEKDGNGDIDSKLKCAYTIPNIEKIKGNLCGKWLELSYKH